MFNDLNERTKKGEFLDFDLTAFDGCTATLCGSFDRCYYHSVEIVFRKVGFIRLPTVFADPVFRFATTSEASKLADELDLESDDVVFAIDLDAGRGTTTAFIAGQGCGDQLWIGLPV